MKKILSFILAVSVVFCSIFAFAGCSREAKKCDIALITADEDIKKEGNTKLALEGLKDYCKKNKLKYSYFVPDFENKESLNAITECVKEAVDKKAEYVILLGEEFAVSAYKIAPTMLETKFILIDAVPHSEDSQVLRIQQNVMSVSFNALDAGFLAGYVSVTDGYKNLGYIGSVHSSNSGDFGAGFAQGISYACDEEKTEATLTYANYDSSFLSYNYTLNVIPKYKNTDIDKLEELNGANIDDSGKTIVLVQGGNGSGLYSSGDKIEISADEKKDGNAFEKWLCYDAYGKEIDVDFEDASSPKTSFKMIDLTPAFVKSFCDNDVDIMFTGGNPKSKEIFDITKKLDTKFFSTSLADIDNEACQNAVVLDYGRALQIALENYNGGSMAQADCSNNSIYINHKSSVKGNKNYDSKYGRAYDALKNGEIKMLHVQSGADFTNTVNSKYLKINYMINEE